MYLALYTISISLAARVGYSGWLAGKGSMMNEGESFVDNACGDLI